MMRSGMETTLRAILYSGWASKRVLCSRVEASSESLSWRVGGEGEGGEEGGGEDWGEIPL